VIAEAVAQTAAPAESHQKGSVAGLHHERFTIPVAHSGALRFYLQELLIAQSRGQMARAALARALARIPRLAGRLLGMRRANLPFEAQTPIRRITTQLRREGIIGPPEPSVLSLADYVHSDRGKLVLFLFAPGKSVPEMIVKASSHPAHAETLIREHETLKLLERTLPGPLARTVPVPLAGLKTAEETIVVERYVGGRSMYLEMRNGWLPRRHTARHFRQAHDWLRAFQTATGATEMRIGTPDAEPFLGDVLRQFEQRCVPDERERAFLTQLSEHLNGLRNLPVPLVARHGDFWAGNVVAARDGVGVFDWERFAARGLPFDDLLMFAATYALNYPWKLGRYDNPARAFARMCSGGGWMHRLVGRHLLRHCADLGLPAESLRIFVSVFLLARAVEEVSHGDAASSANPAQAASRMGQGAWRSVLGEYVRLDCDASIYWSVSGANGPN